MVTTRVIKLREIEVPNARDHLSVRCIPFIRGGGPTEAGITYVRCMRNSNLKIRIAGFSCRPQKSQYVNLRIISNRLLAMVSYCASRESFNPCRSLSPIVFFGPPKLAHPIWKRVRAILTKNSMKIAEQLSRGHGRSFSLPIIHFFRFR